MNQLASVFRSFGGIFLISIVFIWACGRKQIQTTTEKNISPRKAVVIAEKKEIKEKYRYKGDLYRDPFVSLEDHRAISPLLEAKGEGEMPNLGALQLKGIISDSSSGNKKVRIALLSSPMGSYIVKNSKLYDSRNRIVPGIKGIIEDKSVKIITEDNFTKSFELQEIQ